MDLPLGYQLKGEYQDNSSSSNKVVCKLQKSLYELKKASRQWNIKFTECLLQDGFIQSNAYYSLFTKHTDLGFIVVLVYVDDIIIRSENKDLIDQFKASLSSHFKLKDLGNLQYFLGLEIARPSQGIVISQRKFVLELLEEYGVLGLNIAQYLLKSTQN